MRIAVIGAGNIGGTIGGKWEAASHDVVYGLRDPSKRSGAHSIDDALHAGEAILLAIPGGAVVEFAREHGKALEGKIVIDATNNFRAASAHSWAEIAKAAARAQLYRAFNTYGWDVFAEPSIGGSKPDLFYAKLPKIALESGAELREISSPDDNLEAVFRYLTES